MKSKKRYVYIGPAWPYANGDLHLGHAAGLIGADVLARYHRLNGDAVLMTSGSDCHGTPIAVKAQEQGVEPSVIADKYHERIVETLVKGLDFSYDNYTKTTTDSHYKLVQELFTKIYEKGHIYKKTDSLPYCEKCDRFLPDRFIEGECPTCHFKNARGDQCEECGNLMEADKLIDSKCNVCGEAPIWKDSEHFYLKLTDFTERLKDLAKNSEHWRPNAKNFTLGMLNEGLKDRAITRDTDWGVPIPLDGYDDKRIYVWFEAVSGYYTASREWADNKGEPDAWKPFWENEEALHYYVHGKDNIPFHSIIWPSILMGYGGLKLPDRIISSDYLGLEGKQFSKSRNWAVSLEDFLNDFPSDTLRYYLFINGPETGDSDFSWGDFQNRVNGELIGNFGNLVHRTLSFGKSKFDGKLSIAADISKKGEAILKQAEDTFVSAEESILAGRFREAIKIVFQLVEEANRFLAKAEPWKTIKTDKDRAETDLAISAHLVKCLASLINPFMPASSKKIADSINLKQEELKWEYPEISEIEIGEIEPLFSRVEDETVEEQKAKLGKE